MCLCDRNFQNQMLQQQQVLLRQLEVLATECHAWREISGGYPPSSMLKHMKASEDCGYRESKCRGIIEFPKYQSFWDRLKYLFKQ
jgi:hypothetical protein